ncbi:hypothetical protein H072_6563 [Dactylellina haptotyla CBS 200.50]|uniref:Conidiation-specific protein 13 n=1 Tax=Dactylellina haptotyla (strain CBS 200.50) TaxID=1284197 RepID=S8AEQ3_DACHA|nr:hypothetical protein H072_6563 [Dactylellina haptotyla CBS 200.50]
MSKLFKNIFTFLLAVGNAYAQLPRPLVNYPLGLSPVFDQGFFSGTASPPYTVQQWAPGKAPQACVNELAWNNCISGRAVVYNITYNDCNKPWVMCRCENADLSINQMANFFGRMPVHLRSVVRHVMATHQDGCSAYAITGPDDGDIVMQGNCNTQSVWLHETGHQLDARGLGTGVGFSTSQIFTDALWNDTCVADDYGNTAPWEEFAQMTVVSQSHAIYGYIQQQQYPGCFDYQLAALENAFKLSYLTYGGTCTTRIPPTPPVNAVWKRGVSRRGVKRVGPCKFDHLVTTHTHKH